MAVCQPALSATLDMSTHSPAVGAIAASVEDAPRRGALFKVQHDGRTSYLFGTVHAGKQTFFPLEPQVTRALADSNALVLELDVRASEPFQQALAAHGSYPKGDSIRKHLSGETLALLEQALSRAGMSLDKLEQYRPWLLANLLVGAEIERNGYVRSQGVEQFLLKAAAQQSKPLRELESADYQLGLFASMDDAQQETYLRENLAELASGAALKKTSSLIDAWSRADAPGINAAWQSMVSGGSVSAAFMERTLLGKRNPEMAASIENIMKADRTAFVGVGLLHLLGEQGVPELLRQRGYQVEQIY
ncbi:TraB/GumN family protein [Pseudoduganella aquatica]|uniref:TraB/GumN family protein n=1 Tax=Pseudoduganella aquatica TaxID=2660641 RepID=UPI001E5BBA50|nr:TraB/GumN family protein [Pseudoduganella aquatica]